MSSGSVPRGARPATEPPDPRGSTRASTGCRGPEGRSPDGRPRLLTDGGEDGWPAADGESDWPADGAGGERGTGGSRMFEGAAEPAGPAVLDAVPDPVAVLDAEGVIRRVNAAWEAFGADNGGPVDGVGVDYLAACAASDDAHATDAAVAIRAVLGGNAAVERIEYPCHAPQRKRWFRLTVSAVDAPRAGPSSSTPRSRGTNSRSRYSIGCSGTTSETN